MTLKTDIGCGTPQNNLDKQIHRRVLEIFAPYFFFEPKERFFPVDLPTTIAHSSIYHFDDTVQPTTTHKDWDAGGFTPQHDINQITKKHYTTVVDETIHTSVPIEPHLNHVLTKYTNGTIPSTLTVYGTVCSARKAVNSHLISQSYIRDKDVAHGFAEGLILNYYLYFPGRESEEFQSEGDWSGISLLLRETPRRLEDLQQVENLKRFQPVLACYYEKSIDGAPPLPSFITRDKGFRRWKNVKKEWEPSVSLSTHPVVYVSRGRHNCYYEPYTSKIPLAPTWNWLFSPEHIENGDLTVNPDNTVYGYTDWGAIPWWAYVAFPPLFLFVACASGCEYPVHFDGSGIGPSGYQEGEEDAGDDGYQGTSGNTGSGFPSQPPSQLPPASRLINLKLTYVDLDDALMSALWGYLGAWGGATARKVSEYYPFAHNVYQGVQRPSLSAWFLWNLFLDSTYGCSGLATLPPTP